MKKLAILGSTGSIGTSTLSIVEQFPDRYSVAALAAGRNLDEAFAQTIRWRPKLVSMATEELAGATRQAAQTSRRLRRRSRPRNRRHRRLRHAARGRFRRLGHRRRRRPGSHARGHPGRQAHRPGQQGVHGRRRRNPHRAPPASATSPSCPSTASTTPSTNACASAQHTEVKTIWLTASGGPFRKLPLADFADITPEQALKHPTWVMGRRITIDSATMLNKGLEVIEACRLFDVTPAQVRVTVHPQSTVHSLVEYVDGSILAQISVTDMRLPILYALAYPERPASTLTFDLAALSPSGLRAARPGALSLPAPGLRGRGKRRRALHRPQRRRRGRRRGLPRAPHPLHGHPAYN